MPTSLLQAALRCGIQTPFSVRDDLVPYGEGTTQSLLKIANFLHERSSDNPDSAALVAVTATATITNLAVSLAGYDHTIHVNLKVQNLTGEFIAVESGQLFLTDSGGYIVMVSNVFGENSILGNVTVPLLPESVHSGTTDLTWGGGPFNILVNLRVQTAGGQHQNLLKRVKILRPGFGDIPNIAVPTPVYIGLWTRPVEIIEVWRSAGAARWLTLAGQIVNVSRDTSPVRVTSWTAHIVEKGNLLFDLKPPLTFRRVHADGSLDDHAIHAAADKSVTLLDLRSAFVFGFPVIGMPNDVSKAVLVMILHYSQTVGGKKVSRIASCAYPLINSNATLLPKAPVKTPKGGKEWFWGNAPDHTGFDAHAWSGERYCYDLTLRDSGSHTFKGTCSQKPDGTSVGDCTKNESFFAEGQAVTAALAGTVVLEQHASPENFGFNANPQTGAGNFVVTQQPDQSVAGYFHLQQAASGPMLKAAVTVGKTLGHVGNSGGSSEPHLHFGYVTMHPSGRAIISPVAFDNLTTPGGHPVKIVPGAASFKS